MTKKKVLLIEPGYRNKYPPLGLMKLASYHKARGDYVKFSKVGFGKEEGMSSLLESPWDRVYVTTLFSFEWKRTAEAIDQAIQIAGMQPERVFVGGIAASLMHDDYQNEPRWAGVRFIKGLLVGAPANALKLSAEDCDFGADDLQGGPIEERVPDYDILSDISYTYPVRDAYFGYASRGCVRKCAFCGVPKLEGPQREMPPLTELVNGIDTAHGVKKDMVLMDNNITASARYKEVIAELRDLGFESGATLTQTNGKAVKRRVDFNQGVDARILAKSPMYLKEMSRICISPLRIAFDHIGMKKVYDVAIRMAADNEIKSLSNYMLYNFMDSPSDLYERMRLNISLNEELGIRIWSFPMRYQPVNLKERTHVGKFWNRYYLRSFQIMLQATHGLVSGNPSFFMRAYGEDKHEFEHLLSIPHAFIFHRDHYEYEDGRPVLDEYFEYRNKLSESQEQELIGHLAGPDIAIPGIPRKHYAKLAGDSTIDPAIRNVLRFHTLDTRHRLGSEDKKILPVFSQLNPDPVMPGEDEHVEDAGLYDDDSTQQEIRNQSASG
ncbi:radical SAM protein [Candidatus Poribacteria bacterium]|nr:radical SAM protein [Candidatus Poribacteria bacterium]